MIYNSWEWGRKINDEEGGRKKNTKENNIFPPSVLTSGHIALLFTTHNLSLHIRTAVQTLTRDVTKSGERHTPTSPRSPHVRAASSPSPVIQAHHPSLWARGRRGERRGFEKDKGVAALCLQLSEALPEPLNSHNPAALHLYQAQHKGASHFWLHLLHHRGFLEAVNL